MKKILPTFLLLILCVGVLTMGIYAVAPTRNTVDGTINIVAFNGVPVSLEIIKDGETIQEVTNCKAAQPISFGEIDLPTTLGSWHDCPEVRFSIKIKNEGNSAIGAFFTDRSTILGDGELADGTDDIILSKTFKQNSTKIAEMHLSSYTPISAGDTEEMAISFVLRALPTEAQSYNLGLNLYIEEYVASTDTSKKLYKFAEGTTSVTINQEDTEKIFALPRSVTTINQENYGSGGPMLNLPNNSTVSLALTPYFNSELYFVPSNLINIGASFGGDMSGALDLFVSYENPSWSNDNQYVLYNKDKTVVYCLENIYNFGNYYIAPKSLTGINGVVRCGSSGVYDFSKSKLTNIDLDFCGLYAIDNYTLILPQTIQNVSFDGDVGGSGGEENNTITITFTGTTAPNISQLPLVVYGSNQYNITYAIKVPTGSLSAYQTAFNVNNASAVTAGKITFQEV